MMAIVHKNHNKREVAKSTGRSEKCVCIVMKKKRSGTKRMTGQRTDKHLRCKMLKDPFIYVKELKDMHRDVVGDVAVTPPKAPAAFTTIRTHFSDLSVFATSLLLQPSQRKVSMTLFLNFHFAWPHYVVKFEEIRVEAESTPPEHVGRGVCSHTSCPAVTAPVAYANMFY